MIPAEHVPIFTSPSANERPPFYKRKSTYVIVALLLLLCIFLGDYLSLPPQLQVGKPGESLKWLSNNYPALMTQGEVQSDYATLMKGYYIPQTGLFLSFPGTSDLALVQQAATYDEGIVGVLLIALGDLKTAGKLVAFYEKAWERLADRQG